MKHINAIIWILLFLGPSLRAQESLIVVKDKHSGKELPYATIRVVPADGGKAENLITDKNGSAVFHMKLPVKATVSYIGYGVVKDMLITQNQTTITLEPQVYNMHRVVVTGQMKPQPRDKSIYNVEVLGREDIEQKAANNLTGLLSNELDMQVLQQGVLGASLSIRGLSGEHVKILVDGIPVIGRQNGIIDLDQLNLNNVDHVEMVEGPLSVMYGSNALAGAINIITKNDIMGKSRFNANGYYESVGVYDANVNFARKIKNSTFIIDGSRNFFAGYGQDTSRARLWKPKLQYTSGLNYYLDNPRLKLNLGIDYFSEELRDNGPLTLDMLYEKALDSYYYTYRYNDRVDLNYKLNDKTTFSFEGGYSYYRKKKLTYLNDLVHLQKTLADNPDLQDTTTFRSFSGRGSFSSSLSDRFSWQTGFDINYETGQGKRIMGDQSIGDMAAFGSLVYSPLKNLSLQPGLRAFYNTKYNAPLVYALSLKYQPDHFLFRASYGKGFRAPSLKELYMEFIDSNHDVFGNPNLKPETAGSYILSGEYTFESGNSRFSINTDLFYNSTKNKIDFIFDSSRPTWAQYFNIPLGTYITKGIEPVVKYNLPPWISLSVGAGITGRSKLTDLKTFNFSTDYSASMHYKNLKYNTTLAIWYKYTDAFYQYRGNFDTNGKLIDLQEFYLSGYHNMDITLSRPFWKQHIMLTTGVKNLFNNINVYSSGNLSVHGSGSDYTPVGWGRTFFVKLRYRFDE